MENNKIISVLIGLIGACNNNPKTNNTDKIIIEALAFPSSNLSINELIEKIRNEKNIISPDCTTCLMPCGNTSDYDMNRLYNADNKTCELKLNMIKELNEVAIYIIKNNIQITEKIMSIIFKSLAYISYDLNDKLLLAQLNEIINLKKEIKEK